LICPVPAFVTVHDLGYLYHPETHTPFQRWYLNWTTRRHTKVARHIIADSAATRQDLIQHYDADPAKIDVVHLGRDPAIQRVTNPQPVLEKFGIDGPYLLYVGTLQPRKNLLRLLEAFHQISPQFAVSLVLAGGKGWLTDQLFTRIRTLKLDDRVILPGYVSEGDKAALLSGSTAFVYPSLYEGFGIPLLEAMACQTPIVTSNLSSMPEIAGDAALLVDPYDVASISEALRQILSDAAVREALVVRGSKRLAAFSWAKAAQQTLDILTQKIG
jgi:glycosyltransferase involved in cell wall biosynthesis